MTIEPSAFTIQGLQEAGMSADREIQNFRANYYHKLGSTSAVEEKKNLAKLLSNVPIDIRKLEQFCHHLRVPTDYRCELWKILLDVTPIYRNTLEFVVHQRTEHFEELSRVVDVMRLIPAEKQDDDIYKYIAMYLVESRAFVLTFDNMYESEEAQVFSDIACAVSRMDFTACDTYWVARNFTNLVTEKVHPHISKMIEKTRFYLQKEDMDGKICTHLHNIGAFDKLPLADWFSNCYADILPETTFERVWDKVIAGSSLVLVFIAVAHILVFRRPILVMKTKEAILGLFTQVQPDTADDIVRRGIELWQRNGGQLTPSSSRASPAVSNAEKSSPSTVLALSLT